MPWDGEQADGGFIKRAGVARGYVSHASVASLRALLWSPWEPAAFASAPQECVLGRWRPVRHPGPPKSTNRDNAGICCAGTQTCWLGFLFRIGLLAGPHDGKTR